MACRPPASSVHGIILARILEWIGIPYSREFSRPRDQTHISSGTCLDRQILYHWATWEAPSFPYSHPKTFSELLVKWWFYGFVSTSVLNLGYPDDLAWLGRIISWKHWYGSEGTGGNRRKGMFMRLRIRKVTFLQRRFPWNIGKNSLKIGSGGSKQASQWSMSQSFLYLLCKTHCLPRANISSVFATAHSISRLSLTCIFP